MATSDRLLEHYLEARDKYEGNEWFAIALCGSQNYNLADEQSDVDTKFMVFPTKRDLYVGGKMVPASTIYVDGEHCNVHDVRDYMRIIQKQGINFVEVLYTDYWSCNPEYTDLWLELRQMRERIARMDEAATVNAAVGMCRQRCNQIGADPNSKASAKALSNVLRLSRFMKKFTEGAPYEECIWVDDPTVRELLVDVKRGRLVECGIDDPVGLSEKMYGSVCRIREDYLKTRHEFDQETKELVEDVVYRAMSRMIENGAKGE